MSNFIFAIVATVYALVCLTKEADQGNCSTSDSVEDRSKKRAEGGFETMTLLERKKLN
jgi:hypothetical protein